MWEDWGQVGNLKHTELDATQACSQSMISGLYRLC